MMEALFALLSTSEGAAPVAITPPLRRTRMLPEKTEFPLHEGLSRFVRSGVVPFAGTR
ncbi:MAG TPA: hypothetical protein VGF73_09780 [Chthoniobacterales bacterium]